MVEAADADADAGAVALLMMLLLPLPLLLPLLLLLLLLLMMMMLLLLLLLLITKCSLEIAVEAGVMGCVVLVLRVYQLGSVIFVEGCLSSISI